MDASFFKGRREMNFFGDHRFRFHDLANAVADGKFGDIAAGFFGILGPDDVAATFFHSLFKFEEVAIEIVQRFPFDFVAALACRFPIGKARAASTGSRRRSDRCRGG